MSNALPRMPRSQLKSKSRKSLIKLNKSKKMPKKSPKMPKRPSSKRQKPSQREQSKSRMLPLRKLQSFPSQSPKLPKMSRTKPSKLPPTPTQVSLTESKRPENMLPNSLTLPSKDPRTCITKPQRQSSKSKTKSLKSAATSTKQSPRKQSKAMLPPRRWS